MRDCGVTTETEADRWIADPLGQVENHVQPWLNESSYYVTQRLTTPPPWEPEFDGKPVAFMLRFAHMWAPAQLPLPAHQPAGPANMIRYTGFPRLYTALISLEEDDDDDAFLMLLRHGVTALVDRVMIHLGVDRLLESHDDGSVQSIVTEISTIYGKGLVSWLLQQRYGNGVFEAALFHAIGLPYILHTRRIIPAQAWPSVGMEPIEGEARRAWSYCINAKQWPDQPSYGAMDIIYAFEIDSLEKERNRIVRIGLTFTLILRWLHQNNQVSSQMARTCRMAYCCYHVIFKNASPWVGSAVATNDPYLFVANRLSRRRKEAMEQTTRALRLYSIHFT